MIRWLQQIVTRLSDRAIANPWFIRYILLGYGAKGIVYLLIGSFAIQAAFVSNLQASGTYQTLNYVASKPFGKLLVFLLAVTLTGYVWRRLLQTVRLLKRDDFWRISHVFKGIGYLMSAFSYAGVSYSALNIILELGEYDDNIEDWVNQLFQQALGEWLILGIGIGVATVGMAYIYGAYTGSYISDFRSDDLHRDLEKWVIYVGKCGVAARGIAFVLTGVFFVRAAISGNSELAGGMQNALRIIAEQSMGWLWLSAIGSGLICYGLYMCFATVYRRNAIG